MFLGSFVLRIRPESQGLARARRLRKTIRVNAGARRALVKPFNGKSRPAKVAPTSGPAPQIELKHKFINVGS